MRSVVSSSVTMMNMMMRMIGSRSQTLAETLWRSARTRAQA